MRVVECLYCCVGDVGVFVYDVGNDWFVEFGVVVWGYVDEFVEVVYELCLVVVMVVDCVDLFE